MNKKYLKTDKYADDFKLCMIFFILSNILFLYYQSVFFIGNHDWDWVKGTNQVLSLDTGLFEGRYAKFILNIILYGGQVLPILNSMTAFFLLSVGMTLLVRYWRIKDTISSLIVGSIVISSPYILDWLYFSINIIGNFMAIPLVILGLSWAENKKWYYKLVSIICFLIALGVYPSIAEMMIVCLVVRNLIEKRISVGTYGIVLTALIIFEIVLKVLTYKGIIYTGHYNMQTATIGELVQRVPEIILLSFKQLYMSIPFFPKELKIIGLMIIAGAIIKTLQREGRIRTIILWGIGLGGTVLSAFLSAKIEEAAYIARINFYGINFLYAGGVAILLSKAQINEQEKSFAKNIGMLLGILFICLGGREIFIAQKVWNFGQEAEEKLAERINDRIESRIENSITLIPVVAGEQSLRPKYYHQEYDKNNPYMLTSPFMIRHIPSGMLNFYLPEPIYAGSSQIMGLNEPLYIFLRDVKTTWPSEQGLYVDGEYAIIMMTTDGIRAIQAQIPK